MPNICIFARISKYAFAKIFRFCKFSQVRFRRLSAAFPSFSTLSQIWFCSVSQYFARFHNLYFLQSYSNFSQGFANLLLQGFASAKIVVFRNGQFADVCISYFHFFSTSKYVGLQHIWYDVSGHFVLSFFVIFNIHCCAPVICFFLESETKICFCFEKTSSS